LHSTRNGKFRSGGLWASRGLEIRRPGVGVPLAVICRVVRPGAQQAGEPEGGAALALPASAKRTGALERTPVSASEFGVKRRP
jgi:hypothetical protein